MLRDQIIYHGNELKILIQILQMNFRHQSAFPKCWWIYLARWIVCALFSVFYLFSNAFTMTKLSAFTSLSLITTLLPGFVFELSLCKGYRVYRSYWIIRWTKTLSVRGEGYTYTGTIFCTSYSLFSNTEFMEYYCTKSQRRNRARERERKGKVQETHGKGEGK